MAIHAVALTSVIQSHLIPDNYKKEKSAIARKSKSTNKRILVIDDEDDINLVIKIVLVDNGFGVNTFNDPLEALQDLRTNNTT